MGEHSAKTTKRSTMVVESHVTYDQEVKENDEIRIRVIGQRFELFDETISVIGEIVNKNKFHKKGKGSVRKPKLIIQDT